MVELAAGPFGNNEKVAMAIKQMVASVCMCVLFIILPSCVTHWSCSACYGIVKLYFSQNIALFSVILNY